MTTAQQRDRILKKAYELWEAEGRQSGHDMEHWLRAELLIAEAGKPAPKPRKKVAKTKPATKPKTRAAAKSKSTKRKTVIKS